MLSERPLKPADQKTERGKILNPKYNICRDQPTSRASPLRINTLLFRVLCFCKVPSLRQFGITDLTLIPGIFHDIALVAFWASSKHHRGSKFSRVLNTYLIQCKFDGFPRFWLRAKASRLIGDLRDAEILVNRNFSSGKHRPSGCTCYVFRSARGKM